MVGATTTEAAPPFAILFEGWVHGRWYRGLADNTIFFLWTPGGGDEWTNTARAWCPPFRKPRKVGQPQLLWCRPKPKVRKPPLFIGIGDVNEQRTNRTKEVRDA